MVVKKRWHWVPVRLTTVGYLRVEAYSPEDAIISIENGEYNPDEGIGMEVEEVEVTGPPQLQEVS